MFEFGAGYTCRRVDEQLSVTGCTFGRDAADWALYASAKQSAGKSSKFKKTPSGHPAMQESGGVENRPVEEGGFARRGN
jgi:hypothetical protein